MLTTSSFQSGPVPYQVPILIVMMQQLLFSIQAFVSPLSRSPFLSSSTQELSSSLKQYALPSPSSSSTLLLFQLPQNVIPTDPSLPSVLISTSIDGTDVALEDAFTDQIDILGDSTVQLLVAGFGIFILLALIAKFFFNQMDDAIEKVLVEFESTMKNKYESRWVSIESKLKGLNDVERSQKLFEIMNSLQDAEPDLMEKVNKDMGSSP